MIIYLFCCVKISFIKGWIFLFFTESLKKNYQFRFVYNRGKSIANKYLVMYVIKNDLKTNRLGISVSKKVGISVVRSRVTRLIKESYRLSENNIKCSLDIVVIARISSNAASFDEINKSLNHLLRKHNILK